MTSFLFKLLHLLLPTQERILRLGVDKEGDGGKCKICGEQENLHHALIACPAIRDVSKSILAWTQSLLPTPLSSDKAICLDLDLEGEMLGESTALAIVYILGIGFSTIWTARSTRRKVETYQVKADLESSVAILKKSRFMNVAELIKSAIQ